MIDPVEGSLFQSTLTSNSPPIICLFLAGLRRGQRDEEHAALPAEGGPHGPDAALPRREPRHAGQPDRGHLEPRHQL